MGNDKLKLVVPYLWISTSFEERSHPDQADVVVPHNVQYFVIARNHKGILKDWIPC